MKALHVKMEVAMTIRNRKPNLFRVPLTVIFPSFRDLAEG
jgi:hypothetical protein